MKSYTHEPTRDKDLERLVNRDGDWERYFLKSKGVYLDASSTILKKGYAMGAGLVRFLKQHTEKEIEEILDKTGEKGSRLHRAIELALQATPANRFSMPRDMTVFNRSTKMHEMLSNDEWDALLSFANFWALHNPLIVAIEESVYNLKYRYAGTLDAILILQKACEVRTCKCRGVIGKLGIWDWKTGSGIYAPYGAQIASYGNASSLKRILGKVKPEYTAILRIGTSHKTTGGYEMAVYDKEETHQNWNKFLAALTISRDEIKEFDPAKDIYEIPDTIDLKVEYKQLIVPKVKNATANQNRQRKPRANAVRNEGNATVGQP